MDRVAPPIGWLEITADYRCNNRCVGCFAVTDTGPSMSASEILAALRRGRNEGARGLWLGGGEPTLRRDLPALVARLAATPGIEDIALTTNGLLLPGMAVALRRAGLRRVTISLDSLDDATFRRMNGLDVPLAAVLKGIEAARDAGFEQIKLNTVVQRGVNEASVAAMAERWRGTGITVRFIEFMDVGNTNGWRLDQVVPAREIRDVVHARWPIEPVDPAFPGEVAKRWRYRDGQGEIGLISSVTSTFCGDCNRARLSPRGELFTCLFAGSGHDLRGPLRAGATDADLQALVRRIWGARDGLSPGEAPDQRDAARV